MAEFATLPEEQLRDLFDAFALGAGVLAVAALALGLRARGSRALGIAIVGT